jgi:hypothetical protein
VQTREQTKVPGFEEVVSLSHVRSVKRRTLKIKVLIGLGALFPSLIDTGTLN